MTLFCDRCDRCDKRFDTPTLSLECAVCRYAFYRPCVLAGYAQPTPLIKTPGVTA